MKNTIEICLRCNYMNSAYAEKENVYVLIRYFICTHCGNLYEVDQKEEKKDE
jgi:acetone carboxylase gamma subunit